MAIKFFQRSLQIDPFFTYAYTLTGHEHVNNEDMEKAITAFRTAILCHERHYNAWYGLGSIYYRQERFEMSEYHFRKAKKINPRSSVLDCYLGMALNAQGSITKVFEALEVLSDAAKRDPQNPQVKMTVVSTH
jgi:anaphase-promoting complex subunit 3